MWYTISAVLSAVSTAGGGYRSAKSTATLLHWTPFAPPYRAGSHSSAGQAGLRLTSNHMPTILTASKLFSISCVGIAAGLIATAKPHLFSSTLFPAACRQISVLQQVGLSFAGSQIQTSFSDPSEDALLDLEIAIREGQRPAEIHLVVSPWNAVLALPDAAKKERGWYQLWTEPGTSHRIQLDLSRSEEVSLGVVLWRRSGAESPTPFESASHEHQLSFYILRHGDTSVVLRPSLWLPIDFCRLSLRAPPRWSQPK